MKNIITKADAEYMAREIYTNNWLNLGDAIAGMHPKKRYRMTESQVRLIALTILNRYLSGQ